MLAQKPMNIIALIDEESRFPRVCMKKYNPSSFGFAEPKHQLILGIPGVVPSNGGVKLSSKPRFMCLRGSSISQILWFSYDSILAITKTRVIHFTVFEHSVHVFGSPCIHTFRVFKYSNLGNKLPVCYMK